MSVNIIQMIQFRVNGHHEIVRRHDAEVLLRELAVALQRNPDGTARSPEPINIKLAVCLEFEIKPEEIDSDTRRERIAFARQVAMWLCRELTGFSYDEIGKQFPRKGHARNHGTIFHGCHAVAARMDSCAKTRARILALHKRISQGQP